MKITIEKDMLNVMTVSEYRIAKQIILAEKDSSMTPKELAEMVGASIMDRPWRLQVFDAKASICYNHDISNYYTENSGSLDVWIDFKMASFDEYIEGGALLSDIYALDGTEEAKEKLVRHAYIRRFLPEKK